MSDQIEEPRLVGTRKALELVFDDRVRPSEDFLRRAAASGRIHALRVGRKLVFDVERLRGDLRRNFRNTLPT